MMVQLVPTWSMECCYRILRVAKKLYSKKCRCFLRWLLAGLVSSFAFTAEPCSMVNTCLVGLPPPVISCCMPVYLFEPFGFLVHWARGIEGPPPNQKYQMGSSPEKKQIKAGMPHVMNLFMRGPAPGGATPSGTFYWGATPVRGTERPIGAFPRSAFRVLGRAPCMILGGGGF